MDFGLARTFDSRLTTDLYALGVMLYELTTGRESQAWHALEHIKEIEAILSAN